MSEIMVITGGGRGIGAATAKLAARHGYAVAINYRTDEASALVLVAEILAQGGKAVAIAADVSRAEEVARLFATVDQKLGHLTALVNSAGIVDRKSRVEDMDEARLVRMFAVNVIGSFLCTKEAIRRMSTIHGGGGGSIVNVSSAAARHGSPNEYVDYAASKGAIDTFTVGLAQEVASEGIRVNAVRPGIIETEIHASGGDPGRVARIAPNIPMRRAGTAEEVARAILWLSSRDASYSTGAIVDVSGGR